MDVDINLYMCILGVKMTLCLCFKKQINFEVRGANLIRKHIKMNVLLLSLLFLSSFKNVYIYQVLKTQDTFFFDIRTIHFELIGIYLGELTIFLLLFFFV